MAKLVEKKEADESLGATQHHIILTATKKIMHRQPLLHGGLKVMRIL
ncbi:hypothetical protein [Staphylothermus marinus]|nr:hypothetical protein [Staphylothermus marinus]